MLKSMLKRRTERKKQEWKSDKHRNGFAASIFRRRFPLNTLRTWLVLNRRQLNTLRRYFLFRTFVRLPYGLQCVVYGLAQGFALLTCEVFQRHGDASVLFKDNVLGLVPPL
jgi:hypothetical protein